MVLSQECACEELHTDKLLNIFNTLIFLILFLLAKGQIASSIWFCIGDGSAWCWSVRLPQGFPAVGLTILCSDASMTKYIRIQHKSLVKCILFFLTSYLNFSECFFAIWSTKGKIEVTWGNILNQSNKVKQYNSFKGGTVEGEWIVTVHRSNRKLFDRLEEI